jgi:fibronectin type 3 domain-containing protein
LIDIQEFTQSLNENQRIELLENLNGEQGVYEIITDSLYKPELISLFETNLKVNNEVAETYDIEYDEIISGLSKDEVDIIYQEILNSDLLKKDAL